MDERPELRFPEPPLSDGEIKLRQAREADVEALLALRFDPDILSFTEVPPDATAADTRAWQELTERERRAGRGLYFTIAGAASDEFLGTCDLRIPSDDLEIGELGYLLAPHARGAGVAARALTLLISWGFESLGLTRIQALIHPDNRPSLRLVERLGFGREGLLRSYRAGRASREDRVIYSLLPGELKPSRAPFIGGPPGA
jgi:ribosomal-protein-alanine N-acetyltransferase